MASSEEMSQVEGHLKADQQGLDENAEASLRESSLRLTGRTPAERRPQSAARSPRPGRQPARPPARELSRRPRPRLPGHSPAPRASPPPTPAAGARLGPAPQLPRLRGAQWAVRSQPPPGRRDSAGRAGGGGVRLGGARRAAPGRAPAGGAGTAPPRRLPSPSRLPGSAPGGNDVLLPG